MGWKWYVVALCLGTALALVQHWTTEGRQTPRPTKHAPTRPADDLPPQEPVLRIELGMHGAPIRRIGVDRACRLIVTGSADKTARLWDLPEGGAGTPRLNRVFRVPIGPGYNGKINAVALSPDGQIVAAGGFNRRGGDHWVYLFEASTGRTLRRLGPLGNVLFHLTFSPDGGHLAATLGGIEGVRIWETAGWQLIGKDRDYDGDSFRADFDTTGRLYTVADDGYLRRYGPSFELEAKIKTMGGRYPHSIAVHPAGDRLAVGFYDTMAVDVYTAADLGRVFSADTAGLHGRNLNAVTWSADGERLYAGGMRELRRGHLPIYSWDNQGRGGRRDAFVAKSTIAQLAPCGPNIAVASMEPAFGLITPSGEAPVWQGSAIVNMIDKLSQNFAVSPDGTRVRFGLGLGGDNPVLFDAVTGRLADSSELPVDLSAADVESLAVSDWRDSYAPKLNGRPLPLARQERSNSLAIEPGAMRFALGADWSLRLYKRDGTLLWNKPVVGEVRGLNIPRHGKLLVAAYEDGTVRWLRLNDGQELLGLFVHPKDRRFVAWTPKGYYVASPGGDELIGWHVNRGWDAAAEFSPASRYTNRFDRPDIVARVLQTLDEDQAIALGKADRP